MTDVELYFETEFMCENEVFETEFEAVVTTGDELQKQEKSLYIDKNGTHEVYPDNGYVMTKFTAEVNVPERKEEQTKSISVTENGSYSVVPDEDKVLSGVDIEVDVTDNRVTEIETAIDESGVLDSTEGTVEEKVEQVIDYANFKNIIQESIYSHTGTAVEDRLTVFNKTSIADVSMFDFSKSQHLANLVRETQIEELEIDVSVAKYVDYLAYNCKNLKKVILKNMSSNTVNHLGMCTGCSSLKSIETLDFSGRGGFWSNNSNFMFGDCTALEEIRIVKESIKTRAHFGSSPLLSDESIQNIIDGLATVETSTTLYLHTDVVLKLTEEQILTIQNKNWNIG